MNLIPFALFSTKIPSALLQPAKKKQHHFKNLFSLFCDYTFTLFITLATAEFFKLYAGLYLSTVSTKFTVIFPAVMSFITYPLVTFSYFMICFIANDGMTLGTHYTKQRLMVSNIYQQALLMTVNALTLNIFYFKIKKFFQPKDYRYQELMVDKENIDIFTLIKEKETDEVEEDFRMAA